MKYPLFTGAIIDVTKPPYCADNTGKEDCTKILIKILDDILIRQVEELKSTHDKLIELSDNMRENVYIGIEGGKVQNGKITITFPEHEPSSKIIYFPKGTYLVSDTVTYSLKDLKGFWYWVPGFENCRNIHFLGENKEETIIRLNDFSNGFGEGKEKPLISFCNNELKLQRNEEFTNVAFMNTLEDITLDCGKGNPGAIGVKYVSSNCGRIENVKIKTECGPCGIYVANNTTQAVFEDIEISGFNYGIDVENTVMFALNRLNIADNRLAGIYTKNSHMFCQNITYGSLPAVMFKEIDDIVAGRYFFDDKNITFANENPGHFIHFEEPKVNIPKNKRSENPDDFAFVDDFGAKGDGVTECSRAIQKAMNSGKPIIVFGEGEYLINAKIKIPKTVKTVDFLFCSLASGIRLVGGEYDSAFEISEDSEDLLFIENLSAWENFRGHMRFCKHAAKRDIIFSDIHLMTAQMYFNSVYGSTVYFDNCFSTVGTYTKNAWIPGDGFSPAYCHVPPYEFHEQTVFGRVVNPERSDVAILNDASEIFLEGFRTEGPGTALKSINGGRTHISLFNAAIGDKDAENPIIELIDSKISLFGGKALGIDSNHEYNILISDTKDSVTKTIKWDDAEEGGYPHSRIICYNNK